MNNVANTSRFHDLTAYERLRVVQAIWDSIAANPDEFPLSMDQRMELDWRLDDYYFDGNPGVSDDETVARILALL